MLILTALGSFNAAGATHMRPDPSSLPPPTGSACITVTATHACLHSSIRQFAQELHQIVESGQAEFGLWACHMGLPYEVPVCSQDSAVLHVCEMPYTCVKDSNTANRLT